MNASTLAKLKTALRLSTDDFDEDELRPLVDACKRELSLAGVTRIREDDPVTYQAIKLYVKWQFGDGDERFEKAYKSLRDSMSLSGDYGASEECC